MPEMGKYCKAYLLKAMRAYPGWTDRREGTHRLNDDHIVYLQENYVVTDGIYKDESILFDDVTDEWKQYCHGTLDFEPPVYEPILTPVEDGGEGRG